MNIISQKSGKNYWQKWTIQSPIAAIIMKTRYSKYTQIYWFF